MSLRAVTFEVEEGERLTLLLRYREIRRLEAEYGLKAEDLPAAARETMHQVPIFRLALEGGTGKAWSEEETTAVLDRVAILRIRLLLMKVVLEAFGRMEPGDEELLPDPKGEATGSPGTGGSEPSPQPSASA